MRACYHTHTKRCGHAQGEDEAYVIRAIDAGVEILGFSDHAPMIYPEGYVSGFKMRPEEIDGYFSSLLSLREKYRDKIDIKIGFETEYYPDLWNTELDFWHKYPLDYLILGQHFISGELYIPGEHYTGNPSDSVTELRDYCDRLITAINTGKITYIAHPDLFNFTGDLDIYKEEMRRVILEAKRLDIPLEINLLGLSEGRSYPKEVFWSEVGRLGARGVIGCDAHVPERVAKADELVMATKYADKFGVEILQTVPLKKVF